MCEWGVDERRGASANKGAPNPQSLKVYHPGCYRQAAATGASALTAKPMNPPKSRPPFNPLPPGTQAVAQALRANETLGLLTQRIRDSQARLAALQPLLPPAMRALVKAGPIDAEAYTLLVGNQAVSAKLRQMLPALEAHLRTRGWDGPPLRIKLLSPG